MTSIHEATPSQLEAHEAHKARIDRLFSRIVPVRCVENKPVDNPQALRDQQTIADLQAKVADLEAKLAQANVTCPPPQIEEPTTRQPTIFEVKALIAKTYVVSVIDLESNSREKKYVLPRMIAIHLSRRLTVWSLAHIGRRFGDRDHSTALHSDQRMKNKRMHEPDFDAELSALERKLTGGL